jgi:hypothetical protein
MEALVNSWIFHIDGCREDYHIAMWKILKWWYQTDTTTIILNPVRNRLFML